MKKKPEKEVIRAIDQWSGFILTKAGLTHSRKSSDTVTLYISHNNSVKSKLCRRFRASTMVKLPQTKHKKKLKAKLLRNDSTVRLFISNRVPPPYTLYCLGGSSSILGILFLNHRSRVIRFRLVFKTLITILSAKWTMFPFWILICTFAFCSLIFNVSVASERSVAQNVNRSVLSGWFWPWVCPCGRRRAFFRSLIANVPAEWA
jgi:hypothetical protein